MMAPALWVLAPGTGAVLGVDGAGLAARLSIHPDDIARAAMALCLAAEPAVIDAMRQENDP